MSFKKMFTLGLLCFMGSFNIYATDMSHTSNNEKNYVNFVLVRHGETDWNIKKLIQGSSDIPLNENGIRQAQQAAKLVNLLGFQFHKVYSSPLDRALKTAEAILTQLPLNGDLIIEPGFQACSWGVCEGKSIQYRMEAYGYDDRGNIRITDWEDMPVKERWKLKLIPGADSTHELNERMAASFRKIALENNPGDDILIATHQENIKVFSAFCQIEHLENLRLQGDYEQLRSIENAPIKNCGYYHFQYNLTTDEFIFLGEAVSVCVEA